MSTAGLEHSAQHWLILAKSDREQSRGASVTRSGDRGTSLGGKFGFGKRLNRALTALPHRLLRNRSVDRLNRARRDSDRGLPRGMTPQSNFMLLAPIAVERLARLRDLLASMNQPDGLADPANPLIPFGAFDRLHLARFVILDDQTVGGSGRLSACRLAPSPSASCFSAISTAPPKRSWRISVVTPAPGFGRSSPAAKASMPRPISWTGCAGTTSSRRPPMSIASAARCARSGRRMRCTRRSLGTSTPRPPSSLPRIRNDSAPCSSALSTPRGRPASSALSPPDATPLAWRFSNLLNLVGVPIALLLASPLLLVALPFYLYLLRSRELADPEITPRPDPARIAMLAATEDHDVTNPYLVMGSLKPGAFRRLNAMFLLWLLDYFARHVYTGGNLGRVRTIHFARFVFLDGRQRMLFISNYDGTLEAYMDDFVNKVGWGLNVMFSNGLGYPRTDWVLQGGAKQEQKFKYYVRRHQMPTAVWYKAYPGLTVFDLARNSAASRGPRARTHDRRGDRRMAGAALKPLGLQRRARLRRHPGLGALCSCPAHRGLLPAAPHRRPQGRRRLACRRPGNQGGEGRSLARRRLADRLHQRRAQGARSAGRRHGRLRARVHFRDGRRRRSLPPAGRCRRQRPVQLGMGRPRPGAAPPCTALCAARRIGALAGVPAGRDLDPRLLGPRVPIDLGHGWGRALRFPRRHQPAQDRLGRRASGDTRCPNRVRQSGGPRASSCSAIPTSMASIPTVPCSIPQPTKGAACRPRPTCPRCAIWAATALISSCATCARMYAASGSISTSKPMDPPSIVGGSPRPWSGGKCPARRCCPRRRSRSPGSIQSSNEPGQPVHLRRRCRPAPAARSAPISAAPTPAMPIFPAAPRVSSSECCASSASASRAGAAIWSPPSDFTAFCAAAGNTGPFLTPDDALQPVPTAEDRGLRFICLNANITRQFEFVQNAWLARTKFDGLTEESDPLLGNREPIPGCPATDAFSIPKPGSVRRRLTKLPHLRHRPRRRLFLSPRHPGSALPGRNSRRRREMNAGLPTIVD